MHHPTDRIPLHVTRRGLVSRSLTTHRTMSGWSRLYSPKYHVVGSKAVAYLSLYFGGAKRGGGGGRWEGADLRLGDQENGIAIIIFPMTIIVHNKSQMGVGGDGGGAWCECFYM